MPFYVPVGSRGVILRVGMVLIRLMGSWTYRRAHHRRVRVFTSIDALAEA